MRRLMWSWCSSCRQQRIKDLAIAGATAEIAAQRRLGLSKIGSGVLVEQLGAGHQHAGDAVAALYCAALDKSLLERMETCCACRLITACCLRQPLDGGDSSVMGLGGGHQAGHHRLPVQ